MIEWIACMGVLFGAAGAEPEVAADDVAPLDAPERWSFSIAASAWYASPGGRLRMPSMGEAGDELDLQDLNIDSAAFRPQGEFSASRGRWRFSFSGFALSEDGSAAAVEAGQFGDIAFDAGDTLATSLDFSSFQGEAAYRVHRYRGQENGRQGFNVISTVDLHGGMRLYDLDVETTASTDGGPMSVGFEDVYVEPFVGADWALDLFEEFRVGASASVGWMPLGGSTAASLEVRAVGEWRVTRNLGLQFGYRFLRFDLAQGGDDEDFEFNGLTAGLFFGATLRF